MQQTEDNKATKIHKNMTTAIIVMTVTLRKKKE